MTCRLQCRRPVSSFHITTVSTTPTTRCYSRQEDGSLLGESDLVDKLGVARSLDQADHREDEVEHQGAVSGAPRDEHLQQVHALLLEVRHALLLDFLSLLLHVFAVLLLFTHVDSRMASVSEVAYVSV